MPVGTTDLGRATEERRLVWVIVAVVILVGLAGLVLAIGSRLPVEHSVSRAAHFNRSAAEIWGVITDFAGQVTWRPDIRSVERLPGRGRREVWRETDKRGQSLTMETVESVPQRRLVRRIVDRGLAFGGSWTMEIGEYGEVTSLTITEDGEVRSPFFRFVSRFIVGHSATIDGYLKALGKKLGVDVTIRSA